MATQAIRFVGPPGQTITLDVFTLSSDTAEQTSLVCTEETNRKGIYKTADFTDTLSGRHYIVKKIGGTAIGSDFVTLKNSNGTYDSETIAFSIDGYNLEEAMRLILAVNVGKVTATSTSAVFRDAADTKDRVTATTTEDGDRVTITLDAS